MIDFRPALFVIGILLTTLSVAMLAPFAVDIVDGNPDWQVFAGAGLLTLFVGGVLVLTNRSPVRRLSIRQAFVLTAASWLALTTFAALPISIGWIHWAARRNESTSSSPGRRSVRTS